MQAPTTSRPARSPRRRLKDRVVDFFSPTLTGGACGARAKQFRCEPTGEYHTRSDGEAVTRWTATEVAYRCPSCGETIWVLDVPATYPVF